MIDHIMAFATEADAFGDPIVGGGYYTYGTKAGPGSWHSECVPNTMVWDPADDTTETVPGPGGDIEVPIHHPIDDQFRLTITLPEPSDDLLTHPNLELAVDHETGEMLQTTFTDPQLQTLMMQPVFSGSQYPFLSGGNGLVA